MNREAESTDASLGADCPVVGRSRVMPVEDGGRFTGVGIDRSSETGGTDWSWRKAVAFIRWHVAG